MSTNIALADSRPLRGGACDVTAWWSWAGQSGWWGGRSNALLDWTMDSWRGRGTHSWLLCFRVGVLMLPLWMASAPLLGCMQSLSAAPRYPIRTWTGIQPFHAKYTQNLNRLQSQVQDKKHSTTQYNHIVGTPSQRPAVCECYPAEFGDVFSSRFTHSL